MIIQKFYLIRLFPELFEAMQDYEIIKVDHYGLWSDFIYLGTEEA